MAKQKTHAEKRKSLRRKVRRMTEDQCAEVLRLIAASPRDTQNSVDNIFNGR